MNTKTPPEIAYTEDGYVKVRTHTCHVCGTSSVLKIRRNELDRWKRGDYIQDAFPTMTPADREMLISGTHPACWNSLFSEDD